MMLESAKKRRPQVNQPYFERFLTYVITYNGAIPQRHGQTTCHGNAVLCVASRGHNGNKIYSSHATSLPQ